MNSQKQQKQQKEALSYHILLTASGLTQGTFERMDA